MHRLRTAAAAALAIALAGCQNALADADGPMTGTWRFTVTGFQYAAPASPQFRCDMQTTFTVRQEGSGLEGRSEETSTACTDTSSGSSTSLWKPAGVIRGEVENGRVHLSDAGGYHCFAELHPSRMEGYLESYGGEPMQTVRSGTCLIEKLSDVGYDGPRA
ncbi:MAG: hypothetical protein ACJ8GN_30360 [Longimicrobiaceae bacterium]